MAQQVGNWNPPLESAADLFGGSSGGASGSALGGAVSGLAGGKQMNIGDLERLASVVAGGAALFLLSRRLLIYIGMALASVYLLYRGITGYCALYERTNVNTRNVGPKFTGDRGPGEGLAEGLQPVADEVREVWRENGYEHDQVDEASWQSFPASDPPGRSVGEE